MKYWLVFMFILGASLTLRAQEIHILRDKAHAVGYCVLNEDNPYCQIHQAQADSIVNAHIKEDSDKEVYYFLADSGWVLERISGFDSSFQTSGKNTALLFNVDQGFLGLNESGNEIGFYVFDPNSLVNLQLQTENTVGQIRMRFAKQEVLTNVYWREFMTGRTGLLVNQIQIKSKRKNELREFFTEFEKLKD